MRIKNSFSNRASKWSSIVLVAGLIFFLLCGLMHVLIVSTHPMSAMAGIFFSVVGTYWFGTSLYVKFKGGNTAKRHLPTWPADETAVTLKPSSSLKIILRAGFGALVGLIATAFFFDLSLLVSMSTLVLILVCTVLVTQMSSGHQWLYLSTSGMRGHDESGDEARIRWSEEVSIQRSESSTAMWEMTAIESKNGGGIVLPSALLKEAHFKEAVKRFAPDGHPLTKVGSVARFGQ